MPTKYSPRIQRPPSPYRSSQSPRPKSQQRQWRSLTSTGESDSSNAFAEKSREMWLKSLRRGGDSKNPASFKVNVSNPALSSTSDHLRAQLGLPNSARRRKRSSSVDLGTNTSFSPTAMQHKSKEDLCDEIMSLKRALVVQKNDYEVLKTKSRRLEEESARNAKYIDELLDKKTSDEKVRMLAGGGNATSVTLGLKQKMLKLEKRLMDKDNELTDMKRQIKITDTVEMKAAMELYYQEVLRLEDLIKSEKMETSRLSVSMSSVNAGNSAKQGELRKKIVQLIAENNQLTEENRRLRIDMERALDFSENKYSDDDNSDEEIKFSALSKAELVGLVKKTKASESRKTDRSRKEHQDEVDRLKSIISNHKKEKNEVKEENKKLKEDCDRLKTDVDNQVKKVKGLRTELERLEKAMESEDHRRYRKNERSDRHSSRSDTVYGHSLDSSDHKILDKTSDSELERKGQRRYRRYSRGKRRSSSSDTVSRDSDDSSDHRKPVPTKRTSKSRRPATPNTRNKAALSIQKQWHAHKSKKEKEIVELQAALRGHLVRSQALSDRSSSNMSTTRDVLDPTTDSDESGASSDEVVYLQSTLRGHIARSSDS